MKPRKHEAVAISFCDHVSFKIVVRRQQC